MAVASLADQRRPALQADGEVYAQDCPHGGKILVAGSSILAGEGETLVRRWDQEIEFEGCATGARQSAVVADGHLTFTGESRSVPREDGTSKMEMRMFQARTVGTITTAGRSRTTRCGYDMATTFDANVDAGYRLEGTVCGRKVTLTAPLEL